MSEGGNGEKNGKGWTNPQIVIGVMGLISAFYASFVLTGERESSKRVEDRYQIILVQQRELADRQYELSERIAVLETRVASEERRR